MKIIGNIPHPIWKVTIFEMNHRISVKVENGATEQWYKFRDGSGINSVSTVEAWLTLDRRRAIQSTFSSMAKLLQVNEDTDEVFPDII